MWLTEREKTLSFTPTGSLEMLSNPNLNVTGPWETTGETPQSKTVNFLLRRQ